MDTISKIILAFLLTLLALIVILFHIPKEIEIINKLEKRTITLGTITAYTSNQNETDSRPREMASGKEVYDGAIACPSKLKFGHKVVVNGKEYTCEDRMNKRYRDGNNFDVWVPDLDVALEFGVRRLAVEY